MVDVEQDTRLHNVAWSLANAGASVTVLHFGRDAEDSEHVDARGVRWIGVSVRPLQLGSVIHARKARRAWRPLGPNAGRDFEVWTRVRQFYRDETGGRLVATGVGGPERLRLQIRLQRLAVGSAIMRFQDRAFRSIWRRVDSLHNRLTVAALWRRLVPDLYAYELAFASRLDKLAPDVIHAHDLTILGVAVRAKRRAILTGRKPVVVWDSIEDWAGLPHHSTITARYLAAMLNHESEYVGDVDTVITVSNTVARALLGRHPCMGQPVIVMNCPKLDEQQPAEGSLRSVLGLASDVPLMLYSGGINTARGVDVAIAALMHLPKWHLAVVSVPFPHPMAPGLLAQAATLGVSDRVHFAPPVPGAEIVSYLESADVGLIPISTKFANLRAAMPNKLFEYINSGLPVVVSNCQEMADFVVENSAGTVFTYPDAAGLAAAVTAANERFPNGLSADLRSSLARLTTWEYQEPLLIGAYESLLGRIQ